MAGNSAADGDYYPAYHHNAIAVAATDDDGVAQVIHITPLVINMLSRRSYLLTRIYAHDHHHHHHHHHHYDHTLQDYTNYGSWISISAPGNVYSTLSDQEFDYSYG